jgi:hypothetical protein
MKYHIALLFASALAITGCQQQTVEAPSDAAKVTITADKVQAGGVQVANPGETDGQAAPATPTDPVSANEPVLPAVTVNGAAEVPGAMTGVPAGVTINNAPSHAGTANVTIGADGTPQVSVTGPNGTVSVGTK